MTNEIGKPTSTYSQLARLLTPRTYRARKIAAIVLAVSSPLLCAWFTRDPDRWDLFERSGAVTSAVGLLLASRRYLDHGVLELAILQITTESKWDMVELLEDIYTTKLGLGLSAFGLIVWGWGRYLGWWSFSFLVIWAVIEASNAWRDFVHLRATQVDAPPAEETNHSACPRS